MYLIDKKQQLKDFAVALAVPVGLTDFAKWPIISTKVIFPVRNLLVREFISQVETSGIIGHPDKWRSAFDGPTQLWRISHHLINGLTDEQVAPNEIAERILLLLEGIAALNNDHYFERIGKHIILDDADVAKILDVDFIVDKKDTRKALMLAGLLWSYSETNYFVAHELVCEYHGPYALFDGNFAVIREFKNLHPIELWPNRDFSSLPNALRIVTIHSSSLDIGFDAYNNLFDEKGTMATSLLKSAVLSTEGKVLPITEITKLITIFSEKIRTFTDEVDAMSFMDVANKYTDVFWYRKKSLTDYIGVPWKPSEETYKVLVEGLARGPKKSSSIATGHPTVEEWEKVYDYSAFLKS